MKTIDQVYEPVVFDVRTVREHSRLSVFIPRMASTILGLFGASLLYGDGVLTPAISVLSATEGLTAADIREQFDHNLKMRAMTAEAPPRHAVRPTSSADIRNTCPPVVRASRSASLAALPKRGRS